MKWNDAERDLKIMTEIMVNRIMKENASPPTIIRQIAVKGYDNVSYLSNFIEVAKIYLTHTEARCQQSQS